jgi:hypothetical protein
VCKIRKEHKLVFVWQKLCLHVTFPFWQDWVFEHKLLNEFFFPHPSPLLSSRPNKVSNLVMLHSYNSFLPRSSKKPTKNNEVRIFQHRSNMTQTWLFSLYNHKFWIYTLYILNNYYSKSTKYNECIIGFNLTNVWTDTAKARLKSVNWKCLYASQVLLTKVLCVWRH